MYANYPHFEIKMFCLYICGVPYLPIHTFLDITENVYWTALAIN